MSTQNTDESQHTCKVAELMNDSLTFSALTTVLGKVLRDNTCYKLSVSWTLFFSSVYVILFLFGFCGNLFVILVITFKRKIKTVTNLFILNLAVADLLVIVFCAPANLLSNLFIPWILGGFLCKAVPYVQGVSVFSSVYSLVAISLERCRAIHEPLHLSRRITQPQALIIISIIWITGILVILPWAFVFQSVPYPASPEDDNVHLPFCHENWGDLYYEKLYFLFGNLLSCYLIPLSLVTVFNFIVWKSVSQRQIPHQSNGTNSSNNVEEIHRRARLHVFKMVTCFTFSFFICWLPLYVVMTIVKFSNDISEYNWFLPILIPFVQIFGSCNSCLNPILYAFLSPKFRGVIVIPSLESVFGCIRSKKRRFTDRGTEDQSVTFTIRTNLEHSLRPTTVNTSAQYSTISVVKASVLSSAMALTMTPLFLHDQNLETSL